MPVRMHAAPLGRERSVSERTGPLGRERAGPVTAGPGREAKTSRRSALLAQISALAQEGLELSGSGHAETRTRPRAGRMVPGARVLRRCVRGLPGRPGLRVRMPPAALRPGGPGRRRADAPQLCQAGIPDGTDAGKDGPEI